MKLLKLCACGNLIEFSNEDSCEDCFANTTERHHGRSQRVKSYPWLEGDTNEQDQDRGHHRI
jgi:hypothetical protein